MLKRQLDGGDTLIEVMLAIAVFTLAAVSTLVILNQGVAISQRSLDKSLVRQQIDSQAEMIRYISSISSTSSSAKITWDSIVANTVATPLELSQSACPTASALATNRSFFISKNTAGDFQRNAMTAANFQSPPTYAQIDYNPSASKALGVWVQAVKAENASGGAQLDAYDFYINACWSGVGLSAPMTTGTIVRIYER